MRERRSRLPPLKLFVDMLSSSVVCNAFGILPLSLPCMSFGQPPPVSSGEVRSVRRIIPRAAVQGVCGRKVEFTSPCTHIVHDRSLHFPLPLSLCREERYYPKIKCAHLYRYIQQAPFRLLISKCE